MKHILHITAILLLLTTPTFAQEKLPVIAPYHAQNIRELYLDTANHHTALKTILHEDTSAMYTRPDTAKRSWFHRKLFKEHLFEFRNKEYNVFIDFLPDLQLGKSNRNKNLWLNTRGARVQANIGKGFYFETSFYENQGLFPVYLDSFVARRRVIPGQGEAKVSSIGKSYDYSYVNALLSYSPGKYLNFAVGYGTNFIGDGYRSLILSDIGFSYPYLKITGTLGQFQYTSMWTQFMDLSSQSFNQAYEGIGYPKKWGVFHYLDWNATKKLTVGVFDAIIWGDIDTAGRKRGFDWSYMNPIIFLRPSEFSVGSSDNAIIGLNAKYKVFPKTTVYGQFVLDEFKIKELLAGDKWWGNKWGAQLGFRSFDLFKVPRLDLQGELNMVRPYTYSFRNTLANYAHYNQSLAHPMGANVRELLGIASYTYKRWYFRGQLNYASYGLDPNKTVSYGGDIFKPYDQRVKDYDNTFGQGIKTDFLYGQGTVAFVLNPKYNLRLELSAAGRQEKNDLETRREFIFSFGLRSTFRQFYYDF
ncbi:hypothetical protein ACFOTA_13725 [Chitinophaga sp. GCM10012297]|uniref:Gliding motility protein RemB n=1 Tax=Chitinophaga chungangae TaxID=2821488 RepID=A0ABS3YF20_9BACT|nr:hypothetical protein [Chitinophaga chungangae]MBO9153275.1 hypothetical protein [Chitinophaga chungangae]